MGQPHSPGTKFDAHIVNSLQEISITCFLKYFYSTLTGIPDFEALLFFSRSIPLTILGPAAQCITATKVYQLLLFCPFLTKYVG